MSNPTQTIAFNSEMLKLHASVQLSQTAKVEAYASWALRPH
jgi:hypothetical protein